MDISVVIPAYNEEENIIILYKGLKHVLDSLNKEYEIIFVDDGSTDHTFRNISELNDKDKKVRAIQFRKNFGKAAALSAGFELAQGDLIITMDADLQDVPEEIPRFISAISSFDLVSGWKQKRKDPLTKTIPSKIANTVTRLATKIKIHDMNCGFKIYRKQVAKSLNLYGEMHRYIPALASQKGFKVGEIRIEHRPRMHGKSKYGFGRLFKGLFDFMTMKFLGSYAKRPMHFFGIFGLLFFLAGFAIAFYLTVLWFGGQSLSNRPILILAVLLMVLGMQSVSIGLISEMITSSSKDKEYSIKKILK